MDIYGIDFTKTNLLILDEIAAASSELSEVLNKADVGSTHKNAVSEIFAAATYELHRRGLLIDLEVGESGGSQAEV